MTLSREEQRVIGALAVGAQRAVDEGLSTLPGTMHANEIVMEHLALEGVGLLRDYSAKERRIMAVDGRALSDGSYPIAVCEDVAVAYAALDKAPPGKRLEVQAFIQRREVALRCN